MSDTTKITTLIVKNHPYNIYNYKNPLFYHHHWHPGDFLTRFNTPQHHQSGCTQTSADLSRRAYALGLLLQQTARTSSKVIGSHSAPNAEESPTAAV